MIMISQANSKPNLMVIIISLAFTVMGNLIGTRKKKGGKGFEKLKDFNGKKKKKNYDYIYAFYSKSCSFLNDWIVDSKCINHIYFKNAKFVNFHK